MLLRSSFWSAKKGHSVCVKTTYHMRGGTKLPKGWGGGGEMREAALVKEFWSWGVGGFIVEVSGYFEGEIRGMSQ